MVLFVGACGTIPDSGPAPVERRPESAPVTKAPTPARPSSPQRPPVNSAAQNLMDKAGALSALCGSTRIVEKFIWPWQKPIQ